MSACGCIKCWGDRLDKRLEAGKPHYLGLSGPGVDGWRYACELCGNKRCPHHSDHTLTCTNSNEVGQPGSLFA